jgi:ATP-dependent helicase/DNAse subunit B
MSIEAVKLEIPKLKHLSASRLKTFTECELKHHYNYVVKLPRETNDGAMVGSVVHQIYEDMYNQNCFPKYSHLIANACKKYDLSRKTLIRKVIEMCESLKKMGYWDTIDRFHGAEVVVDMLLNDCETRIFGYIDRLDIIGSHATVIDIKTQKVKFSKKELDENLQGKIYTLAIKRMFPHLKSIDVEFWQAKHNLIQKCNFFDEADEVEKMLIDAKFEIEACNDPQPKKNQYCRWCPGYKAKLCPAFTYSDYTGTEDLVKKLEKMKGSMDGAKI